jgi:hypothetical protein
MVITPGLSRRGFAVPTISALLPPMMLPVGSRWCAVLGILMAVCGVGLGRCAAEGARKPVAVLTTVYRHNSHADVIASRLVLTDMLDGTGRESPLRIASAYVEQRPPNDISRLLAASHRFRIATNIADALTLGTGKLAVEGVLLIAEHGDYPRSATGNTRYPKRRFWDETVAVFRQSGRVVPVFVDKHLADTWEDARHIHATAREMGIPLMAGSSVPGSWRFPPLDVPRGAVIDEVVIVTYGSTDHYGFHALECLQAVVEQRRGGETGIRSVRSSQGGEVWRRLGGGDGRSGGGVPADLLEAALGTLSDQALPVRELKARVKKPVLWQIEYADGLRASVVELNGAIQGWAGAWRLKGDDRRVSATRFWTQEARPAAHFTLLLHGIEGMMLTGKPSWRAERTLMTSGLLDALLQAGVRGNRPLETPWLDWSYASDWRWHQPPPPPPSRPWGEQ